MATTSPLSAMLGQKKEGHQESQLSTESSKVHPPINSSKSTKNKKQKRKKKKSTPVVLVKDLPITIPPTPIFPVQTPIQSLSDRWENEEVVLDVIEDIIESSVTVLVNHELDKQIPQYIAKTAIEQLKYVLLKRFDCPDTGDRLISVQEFEKDPEQCTTEQETDREEFVQDLVGAKTNSNEKEFQNTLESKPESSRISSIGAETETEAHVCNFWLNFMHTHTHIHKSCAIFWRSFYWGSNCYLVL